MKNLLFLIVIWLLSCSVQAQETNTSIADEIAAERTEFTENLKFLERTVGEWNYTLTLWTAVSGPEPTKTTGEADNSWVLGGRFIQQETHGKVFGEQFEGISYIGYDSARKQYTYTCMMDTVTCMMDTRGSSTLSGTGEYDEETRSLTLEGEFMRTGRWMPFKVILKLDSPDSYTMEVWQPGIYDILYKSFEVAYSRKN